MSRAKAIADAGLEITKLTAAKNVAYGDAVTVTENILLELYPDGAPVESYPDLLLTVRVLDKLIRISRGDKEAFGESPWKDIAGYGILGYVNEIHGAPLGDLHHPLIFAPPLVEDGAPRPDYSEDQEGDDPATEYV